MPKSFSRKRSQDQRIVITVDGLAGTGKTSVSLLLAKRLGFVHFSTGLLYRAVGLLLLESGVDPEDKIAAQQLVEQHKITLGISQDGHSSRVLIDGSDVTDRLYMPEISESTSRAAQHEGIRQRLLALQRGAFSGSNLVVEGRDAGSIVFPDAALKFYIDTDEVVKVERRLKQLEGSIEGRSQDELNSLKKQMKIEIHERDDRDRNREYSPTRCMPDMVFIDNSTEPLEFVVEKMYKLVTERVICSDF